MKKLFLLALVLMVSIGIHAQSLLGEWKTDIPVGDDQKVQAFFEFDEVKFLMKISARIENDEAGIIVVSADIPGVYSREGSSLVIRPDGSRANARVDKMELKPDIQKAIEEMPELKEQLTNTITESIKELRDELAKGLGNDDASTEIVELTATKLVLRDSNSEEDIVFTRVR